MNEFDLPFRRQAATEVDLSDAAIAGGLVIMAAVLPVPEQGLMPALVYRFAKPDGTGFYPPIVLAIDEDQMAKTAQLTASAVAAAIQAATPPTKGDPMGTTSDPLDPRLTRGADAEPAPQAETYLVLSDSDRAQGFVRPVRRSYRHNTCGSVTTMAQAIAETYARDPGFYGATYCCTCRMHRPVGPGGEFVWVDDESDVGT